jgi:hypothetical protein
MALQRNTLAPSGQVLILQQPEELIENILLRLTEALKEYGFQRPPEPQFVSQKELCKIMGVCAQTLMDLRKEGRINPVHLGNKLRFEVNEVWQDLKATEPAAKDNQK